MSESWEEKRKLLREQAEKLLTSQSAGTSPKSHAELERVIHDLSVHQIELELQNEELLRAQQQLQAALDSYARLYNQAPVGYLSLDERGIILQTNQTFAEMVGIPANEIIQKPLAHFLAPQDRAIFLGRFKAFFNHPQDKSLDAHLICRSKKNPGELFVRLTGRIETDGRLPGDSEPRTYLLAVVSDISLQKRIEDALRKSEELFRLAFENANVGMCLVALNGKLMKVNQEMCRIFGYSASELQEMNISDFDSNENQDIFIQFLERAAQGGQTHFTYEKQSLHKDGHLVWIQLSVSLARDEAGKPLYFVAHIQDITERKQAEDALCQAKTELEAKNQELYEAYAREQLLARTDALTGLYNRRYFFELAAHQLSFVTRYGYPLSMILFDIDHFKEFNDYYGHQAGDDMLRSLAQLAHKQLRKTDILARYGGEEFIVLLPYTKLKQARQVAERIRKAISALHLRVGKETARVTISLGVAEFDSQTDNIDTLIQRSDQAMYEAKNGGRNQTMIFGESISSPT